MRDIFLRFFYYFISLLITVSFLAWSYLFFVPVIASPTGLIYEVTPGLSKPQWVEAMYQLGVVRYPKLLLLYVELRPFSRLKSGEYFFKKNATQRNLFNQVTTGTGLNYRAFTITPGMTFKKLRAALGETSTLKPTLPFMTNDDVMTALGEPGMQPEGMFLPETYHYAKGVSDFVILQEARALMKQTLVIAWHTRSPDLPFQSPYEALTAASLVQMEAFLPEEKPVIAGVLINRLKQNMRLQFDPTVIYGMGDNYHGTLTHADLHTDTPYNTYMHAGLPPTPIAMPGREAIHAVLQPATHDYLYFVVKGGGAHQFSATFTQHNEAVKNYILLTKIMNQGGEFFNSDKIMQYLFQIMFEKHK